MISGCVLNLSLMTTLSYRYCIITIETEPEGEDASNDAEYIKSNVVVDVALTRKVPDALGVNAERVLLPVAEYLVWLAELSLGVTPMYPRAITVAVNV